MFFLPIQYLIYLFKAKGQHGTHSAFVYELYSKVVKGDNEFYDFEPIEYARRRLLHSKEEINVVDFGSGKSGKRRVRDIASTSLVPAKKGRMLYRLVNFVQPKVMIELGTSLGISTLYQAKACPNAELITVEGSPETATLSETTTRVMKADNVKHVTGNFDEALPKILERRPQVDYIFFDGNHKKEPTLNYFKQCMPHATDGAVFVFDDIRWSKGMYEAWQEIIKEPTATVTVDMFTVGLVFFRKGQKKQHFTMRF